MAKKPEPLTGENFMKSPEIIAAIMVSAAIDSATSRLCAELGALTKMLGERREDN